MKCFLIDFFHRIIILFLLRRKTKENIVTISTHKIYLFDLQKFMLLFIEENNNNNSENNLHTKKGWRRNIKNGFIIFKFLSL